MGAHNYEELIELYHNINVYCLAGALIFLAIAVVLFYVFKIPKVFGELTGRTAKKAIDEMLAESGETGALSSGKVDHDGRRRRKAKTGSFGNTGRMGRKLADDTPNSNQAMNPYTQQTEPMVQPDGYDTYGSQETDVLDTYGSQETDVLDTYGSQETDVLSNSDLPVYLTPESETMVLDQSVMNINAGFVFVIERSIVEIHTDEVI